MQAYAILSKVDKKENERNSKQKSATYIGFHMYNICTIEKTRGCV